MVASKINYHPFMLEQLFGSKTRVLLLRLFLNNPENFFYVRELTRRLGLNLNSVRRELDNLRGIGIIESLTRKDLEKEAGRALKDNKKYYKLNNNFVFIEELKALLIKAQLILEQSLVKRAEKIGNISYFLLSGIFVGRRGAPVDLLIVGSVNRLSLRRLIKDFEKELGQSINYTVMSRAEFIYRKNVTDRFIYDLLEGRNLVVIDKLFKKNQ